jgi:hypothetical protein
MEAVSVQGSTICIVIPRLNSSFRRSIAFNVRIDFHWLRGERVKVNSLSPASSKLSTTARLKLSYASVEFPHHVLGGSQLEISPVDCRKRQTSIAISAKPAEVP